MKSEKGFTLIEVILAISILSIVTVVIFKSFYTATVVNKNVYEEDMATVKITNLVEKVKKNPWDFVNNNKISSSFFAESGKYDNLDPDGTRDAKLIEDDSLEEVTEKIRSRKIYCDSIRQIRNEALSLKYYDNDWNETDEANAKYLAQISIRQKKNISYIDANRPKDANGGNPKSKYIIPSAVNYLIAVIKSDIKDEYAAFVCKNYDFEGLKNDLGTKINNSSQMFRFLHNRNNNSGADYGETEEERDDGSHSTWSVVNARYNIKVSPDKIENCIPVRLDFQRNISTQKGYNIFIYNATDKPVKLFLISDYDTNKTVNLTINQGDVNTVNGKSAIRIDRAYYNIGIKIIRKQDNKILAKNETTRYSSNEPLQSVRDEIEEYLKNKDKWKKS